MTHLHVDTRSGASDQPLEEFAHCHEGILSHLHELRELPELVAAAERARKIASDTMEFFHGVVFKHHVEEEKDLFPIVLQHANAGEERQQVQDYVRHLTAEHRQIEAEWRALEPDLKKVAKGQESRLDLQALGELVDRYDAHARLEEARFLPLAKQILGRQDEAMAQLGLSLHTRHVVRAAREGQGGFRSGY